MADRQTAPSSGASTAPATPAPPDLSLIVPCYNEEGNVEAIYREAFGVFEGAGISLELVLVDDGSSDGTMGALRRLIANDRSRLVRAIGFTRNFGKESAMYAGMQEARGRFAGFIDADLQQDPAVALEMYRYLLDHPDCDMVAAYQDERREGAAMRAAKRCFYRVFNAASDEIDIPADASDFRVFKREVADALLSMPEYFRFSKGLFAWVGFHVHTMPYTVRDRGEGKSAWTLRKLISYAMTGVLSFTTWPLRIAKWIGFLASMGAMLYLLYVLLIDYLINGIDIPGYPTLVCLILLIGGIQMFLLGIIGEYLGRDYLENKRRPIYLARERLASRAEGEGAALGAAGQGEGARDGDGAHR